MLRWSILRAHPGDAGARPFLIVCDGQRTPQTVLSALRAHGFQPLPVEALPMAPIPGRPVRHELSEGWLRLHLWRLTSYRRIVYLDSDVVVLGSLEQLFELPPSVHLAAAALGPEELQKITTNICVYIYIYRERDIDIFVCLFIYICYYNIDVS